MKKYKICLLLFFLMIINLGSKGQTENNHLKIMSYNIRGWGLDNICKQGIIDVINKHKPDIIGLQEVDSFFYRCHTITPDDVSKRFADSCSMHRYFAGNIYVTEKMLQSLDCPLPRDSFPFFTGWRYGNAALGVNKALKINKVTLPTRNPNDPEGFDKVLQIIEYENYVLFNTHLISNHRPSRIESAEIINNTAKLYNKPIFLVGDLNPDKGSITRPLPAPYPEMETLEKEWTYLNDTTKITSVAGYRHDYMMGYLKKDKYNIPQFHYNIVDYEVLNDKWSDHYPLNLEVIFSDIPPQLYTDRLTVLENTTLTMSENIIIKSGATLELKSSTLRMGSKSTILVETGATLIVSRSNIYYGNIIVKKGGKLIVKENGRILIDRYDNVDIREGGLLELDNGEINLL